MSGQPALDAGPIRRNRFKLAMSVGDNRHYVAEQIQPRHFEQSANACGMPAGAMRQIFDELLGHKKLAVAVVDQRQLGEIHSLSAIC
jgi:serine/threonine-protein kinase HipA